MVYFNSVFVNAMHKKVIIGAALFWGTTQPKSLIPYPRYETKYESVLQGSKFQ